MTQTGTIYGEALYSLCLEEHLTETVLPQLQAVSALLEAQPEYLRLLSSPAVDKQERCSLLEQAFRDQVHVYLLNFLKILTEKGCIRHFPHCCQAFLSCYRQDHGILPVTAVSAIALTQLQQQKLIDKLSAITGKTVELTNRVNPAVLGGIRLDLDGRRLDDTVAHRLNALRDLLQNTVL